MLERDLAVVGRDRGLIGGKGGGGLVEVGAEIAVVDDREHVTLADRLVVGDPYFLDIAVDARADDGDIALHIGVVGRLLEPAHLPPIVSTKAEPGQNAQQPKAQRDRPNHVRPSLSGVWSEN
jgi:hypothetical protein